MFWESHQICCLYFTLNYISLSWTGYIIYILFLTGKNTKLDQNTICLWHNLFGFFLYVWVCFGLLVTCFSLPLLDSVAAQRQVFSVQLQRASSDSEIQVYSVVILSSQSCSSYCFLLKKMLYDRLREAFSSSCILKLFSFSLEVAAVSFILDTFVRCFHTFY